MRTVIDKETSEKKKGEMSDGTETAASLDTALGPILKKILDARSDTVKDDDATKTKEADAVEEEASEALRAFMGPGLHPSAESHTKTPKKTYHTRTGRRAQTAI